MSRRKRGVTRFAVAALACSLLAGSSFADSQARIVRLSDVKGEVQVDRNTGQGYEKAFLNLPITQGAKLRTKDDGRAEVEFEDGSTLRITPGTVVEFSELSLRDSGAKISNVKVQEGTAYLNFGGAKNDEFTLSFGHEKLALRQPAHLRVALGDTNATLAVFKGDVKVEGASSTVEVGKRQSVSFDLADQDRYTLAKNLEQDPYDSWDKQQQAYHQQYMGNSSYRTYSPYAYGVSDLNYYGNFFTVPGYGTMWQPYFAGAGWDPFMNGAWLWYPGFGYTWVSSYPWGWTPYRYGSWRYISNYGWAWQPGGAWTGWNTVPAVLNPPQHFVAPQPPTGSGQGTVVVNRGPFTAPSGGSSHKLVIRNDSAGLGIPRGGIRNMSALSQLAKQEGSVTARAQTATIVTAHGSAAGNGGGPSHSMSPRMSAPASASHSTSVTHSTPHR